MLTEQQHSDLRAAITEGKRAMAENYDDTVRCGITEQGLANMWRNIGMCVRIEIANALAPIERRLTLLEAKGIAYHGSYQRSAEYKRGDVVTQSNCMWIAISADVPPNEIPGMSALWQLADTSKREQERRRATQGGPRTSGIVERR